MFSVSVAFLHKFSANRRDKDQREGDKCQLYDECPPHTSPEALLIFPSDDARFKAVCHAGLRYSAEFFAYAALQLIFLLCEYHPRLFL